MGGAGRPEVAGAVELKPRVHVHAHERHRDAHCDAIGDAELESERGHAPLGAYEQRREVVTAHEEPRDPRAAKRGMGLAEQRRADRLLVPAGCEFALPRRDDRLEGHPERPGARRIGARDSLSLTNCRREHGQREKKRQR